MDIEKEARDYLRGQGLPCEFSAGEEIAGKLVTVRSTSRPGQERFVGTCMLTIQAWADTRGAACELCNEAVDALVGRGSHGASLADSSDGISGCSPENGPYRWDDPDTKDKSRWQATVSVTYNA